MSSFSVPAVRNATGASAENSVTAIIMRNRAILYESNNPSSSFNPSVLNLLDRMPNDEASESRFFARSSEKRQSHINTTMLLDGAADVLQQSVEESPENSSSQIETVDDEVPPLSFFRCCQCQQTSNSPTCKREEKKIGVVQGKEQKILVVNSECEHEKCSRCVNVDENGVRLGVKPWELEWTGPVVSKEA
ncbi:uncharacterized protein EAF01_009360 [Botrytis porri]|uniref:Uncharacterized protein n=1 Tax=Botrytis porri TaxID=87229 RepID=A0A4Z1KT13_9HELO|nr:uncharacterized protein EAF01_009360 [Botrytis porri]KAF7896957.1 hypothetical protein EAF01_009360 [Botrytis porri]TGO86769.1 hypothetical protein BPOR_0278g00110 [Botrytis porri]